MKRISTGDRIAVATEENALRQQSATGVVYKMTTILAENLMNNATSLLKWTDSTIESIKKLGDGVEILNVQIQGLQSPKNQ